MEQRLRELAQRTGREADDLVEDVLAGYFGAAADSAGLAALEWSRCQAVESLPGKLSGAWVLKGTRMPVATIFQNLEAGAHMYVHANPRTVWRAGARQP